MAESKKFEKFFYPLMIVAAIVTIWLALRKQGTTSVNTLGQQAPPQLPVIPESVITPASNNFTTNYIEGNGPPPAGTAIGTNPTNVQNGLDNALPSVLPNFLTSNMPGLPAYSQQPTVVEDPVGACCATGGVGSTSCGNSGLPPALPDGAGLCGSSKVGVTTSALHNMASRLVAYSVKNVDTIYDASGSGSNVAPPPEYLTDM